MNRAVSYFGLAVLVMGGAQVATAAEDDPSAAGKAALLAVRSAASTRDLVGLPKKLAAAKKLSGEEKFNAEFERLDELCDYLTKFWQAVDKAGRSLTVAEEFKVGETRVAVAEFDGNSLTLRVDGKNQRYTLANIPPKLCLALAQQALKADDPRNKVCFASFLLLDGKGDRAAARKLFDEAKKGGVDVTRFLPEFEGSTTVASDTAIEIPAMTPAMRLLLSDKLWQIRKPGEKGFVRAPLEKALVQSREGQLVIKLPAAEAGKSEGYQLTTRRTFAGNFGLRWYLQNVPEKQMLVFTAETGDDRLEAPVPAGTVLIEMGRQGTELKCRINGQDVELKPAGKATGRLAGLLGISLPAGAEVTIAALELAGK